MVDEPSPWQALGGLATVGITLVVAIAGATIGGYFLDRWLGTNPLFTLIGLGVGIATGVREFLRTMKRWQSEERDGR
jgi:ATP synthase protein I